MCGQTDEDVDEEGSVGSSRLWSDRNAQMQYMERRDHIKERRQAGYANPYSRGVISSGRKLIRLGGVSFPFSHSAAVVTGVSTSIVST